MVLFFFMFYTYVIYSDKADKIYIDFSSNLKNRLIAHNLLKFQNINHP